MEGLYQKYKGKTYLRHGKECVVAGYSDAHLILATETTNRELFFRKTEKSTVIGEEFKDPKYRYMYIDDYQL